MNEEIVRCANRNCGLIGPLETWIEVQKSERVTRWHCPRCNWESFYPAKVGESEKAKTGAQLIALERTRQLKIEKYPAEHDDGHRKGELSMAGACYAALASLQQSSHMDFKPSEIHPPQRDPLVWPWNPEWWKPADEAIRNLVKAGALIAAEIDRLQRIKTKGNPES